jgi:hypothetical protein
MALREWHPLAEQGDARAFDSKTPDEFYYGEHVPALPQDSVGINRKVST